METKKVAESGGQRPSAERNRLLGNLEGRAKKTA